MRCHLKQRDGWTKVMDIPEPHGNHLVVPFQSRPTSLDDIRLGGIQSKRFELVKTVTITDHLRNARQSVEKWYTEC